MAKFGSSLLPALFVSSSSANRDRKEEEIPNPRFVIKVCGITTEEDLETSLAAGANAIGFNFYEQSPRYITPDRAQELVESVRGDYLKVGVFVNPQTDDVLKIAAQVPLNVLQLHGDRAPLHLAKTFSVWQGMRPDAAVKKLSSDIEAFLLDAPSVQHGGTGKTFDWALAKNFPRRAIIAGGLDGSNVISAINTARPWGVDACSRLESRPAYKDPERIKEFVGAALAAFQIQEIDR